MPGQCERRQVCLFQQLGITEQFGLSFPSQPESRAGRRQTESAWQPAGLYDKRPSPAEIQLIAHALRSRPLGRASSD